MPTTPERGALSFRRLRVDRDHPASTVELARAYSKRMPDTHLFSHATAALIHGMWLPDRFEADRRLHVTVPAGTRAPQVAGIVGHEGADGPIHRLYGFPVTGLLRTWIDLGPLLSRGELVAAADYLCSGRDPQHTPDELRAVAAALTGRRGCRALRVAAALARAAVDSPQETKTRLFLVDAGIPEPIVNFVIRNSDGYFVARVDLAWPRFRVCIEYEGDVHRSDARQFRKDITRRERIEDEDWRMVRITDDDLKNGGSELLRRVRTALTDRGGRW